MPRRVANKGVPMMVLVCREAHQAYLLRSAYRYTWRCGMIDGIIVRTEKLTMPYSSVHDSRFKVIESC